MTRSGRVYSPPQTNPNEEASKDSPAVKQPVSDEEAAEFLKLVKRSEYKVVETLSKTPAQISMLALLLSSEPHRKVLLRTLNEAYVPGSITTDKFADVVGYVLSSNQIYFNDEELTEDGRGHNKPLHITVTSNGMIVGRVLIDNGSALNICPLATLNRLGVDQSKMRSNGAIIRAFDESKRDTLGEVELVVTIGPADFNVTFQVLDIPTTYNMLLGRPWIHIAGAVPSTLHQKIKFVHKDSMVTIEAEEDHAIYKSPTQQVHGILDSLGYRESQVINASYVGEGTCPPKPMIPKASIMMAKQLKMHGYKHGKGLGRELQGITKPVLSEGNSFHFGLGFKPSRQDYKELIEKKELEKEGIRAPLDIPPIRATFPTAKEVGFYLRQENVQNT